MTKVSEPTAFNGTTQTCPPWCIDHRPADPSLEGDRGTHKSDFIEVSTGVDDVQPVYVYEEVETGTMAVSMGGKLEVVIDEVPELIDALQELYDAVTPAGTKTVDVMRGTIARAAGRDLDAMAQEVGIDLERATMADLKRLGRNLVDGAVEVSVSVS